MKLVGKTILITGATGGLGSSLAKRFTKEGANLLLFSRNEKRSWMLCDELESIRQIPDQTFASHILDASCPDLSHEVERQLASVQKVDVLINNSALHGPVGPLVGNSLEEWRQAFDVNFYFPLTLSREVLKKMIPARSGKIINISGGGATSSRPNFSSYGIAKTALVRLTEVLADEVLAYNIQVNAVSPGIMATNLLKEVLDSDANRVGAKELEAAKSAFAINEAPEEAIGLCVFLASNDSNGITGRLISAKWDNWKALAQRAEELNASDIYKLRRIVPEERGKKW